MFFFFFFLMIRRPPRSTLSSSSAASDVYKRQTINLLNSRLTTAFTRFAHPPSSSSSSSSSSGSSDSSVQSTGLVDLSHIGMTTDTAASVAQLALAELSRYTAIDVLVLSCNSLGDSGLQIFLSVLSSVIGSISSLEMFDVGMSDVFVPALLKLLHRYPKVSRLKIGDNHITHTGMAILAGNNGAAFPSTLTQLHLGGNVLGDEGVYHLSQALKQPSNNVAFLGLRNVGMTVVGLSYLADAVAHTPSRLTELQLRDNDFTGSISELSCIVSFCSALSLLDVSNTNLTNDALLPLLHTLTADPTHMKELILSKNEFDRKTSVAVRAYLLSYQCRLSSLDVSKMSTRHISNLFIPLLEGIIGNKSVTSLNLSGNCLEGPAGEAAALAVGRKLRLHTLNLAGCSLGPSEMSNLFDALASNISQLKSLAVSNNLGGEDCIPSLCRLMSFNTHLTKLEFQDNNITSVESMMEVGTALLNGSTSMRNCRFGGQSATANVASPAIRLLFKDALAPGRANRTALSYLKHNHPKAFWESNWPTNQQQQQQEVGADALFRCTPTGEIRVVSPFALSLDMHCRWLGSDHSVVV
eukprot:TRINITY_DN4005_c0_g1_i7.p1 TRINITY_DN4005_c0_g1~~TRINITY_DN4005_c0_g1_i7.p1  ORF type:complete len:582 (-),score=144.49 TRINITY_DN4005_c0_g1_i7:108-1853(-)